MCYNVKKRKEISNMKLSNKTLSSLVHGAYKTLECDGYLTFRHYTDEQTDYLKFSDFFHPRSMASSSVTIEFETDAQSISFDIKLLWVGSKDTIDLYTDGVFTDVFRIKDMGDKVKGKVFFTLPEGKKRVTVYLPIDSNVGVKNFTIDGKWKNIKKKSPKVLWIGDSITQGFGTFITSETYVNVAARALGYDVLNQGIGGYYFDSKVLMPMEGYTPDKIIIAMGTNQHRSADNRERIESFFDAFAKLYANVPTLVLTPIWRNNPTTDMELLKKTADMIYEICGKYDNVTVIDGFTLVPNLPEYFCDGLHPNALGGELYGNNLAKKIKELKF